MKKNNLTKPFSFLLAFIFFFAAAGPFFFKPARAAGNNKIKLGIYTHDEYGQYAVAKASEMGADFTYVNLFWAEIEPRRGSWDWEAADSKILPRIKNGIETGVKLISSNHWATEPVGIMRKLKRKKGRILRDSSAPRDLTCKWADKYAYSKSYYEFVYNTVSRYKGKVKYWAIENEITYKMNFTAGLEKYKLLLATAYKAVKDADRYALVLNHGPSSASYAEAIAFELFNSGRKEEALDFYNKYTFPNRRNKPVKGINKLQKIFKKENAAEKYKIIIEGIKDTRNYDIYQLHYYDKAGLLDSVLSWINDNKKKYSNDKPVACWEMGYYWKNSSTYDEKSHAADIFKKTVILPANNIRTINYHSLFGKSKKEGPWRRLYESPAANQKRPAGYVYENLIKTLKEFQYPEIIKLDEGLYRAKSQNKIIYFIWQDKDKKIDLPPELNNPVIYDIYGHTRKDKTIASGEPFYIIADSGNGPAYIKSKITNIYPHNQNYFTQGLVFENGVLYEGTGIRGESALYKIDLKTGKYLQTYKLPRKFFGEGVTIYKDKIIQITWQSHAGFVYDKESFKLLKKFSYPAEGWGITSNAKQLIMSDGSSTLHFLDPETFEKTGQVKVRDNDKFVTGLNELEYIKGKIFANILGQTYIAIISPETGQVTGKIDLKNLIDSYGLYGGVLNGIAYDKDKDRLFITGKLWPKIFEIELIS